MSTVCQQQFTITVKSPVNQYYAYYKCEESALPIIDSVSGRNITSGFIPAKVSGKIGFGYDLRGTGKRVWIGTSEDFKFLTGNFTIRCWYYEPASWNFLNLLSNDKTDPAFEILINDDPLHHGPTWKMWDAAGIPFTLVHNAPVSTGWHRIIVWYESMVGMGMKVDDLPDETTPQEGGIYEPSYSRLTLGWSGTITEHVMVDEIAIWDRLLTASEMTADWNNGDGVTYH